MKDQIPSKNDKTSLTNRMVVAIAVEFGFIIAIPLVVFGFLGKWLSNKYDNKLFLAGALVLALLISTICLYRMIFKLYKKLTE
jgi:undecaprenyl pyrophosphate phosphatase UppP